MLKIDYFNFFKLLLAPFNTSNSKPSVSIFSKSIDEMSFLIMKSSNFKILIFKRSFIISPLNKLIKKKFFSYNNLSLFLIHLVKKMSFLCLY